MKTIVRILVITILLISIGIYHIQAESSCYEKLSHDVIKESQMPYASEKRYPQTIVHDIVETFLSDKKTNKKVLVLGYDGFREDTLRYVIPLQEGAISTLLSQGGLYHSYTGASGKQKSETAPGWLSILSGDWAYKHGVYDNDDVKSSATKTFLQKAENDGYRSVFSASWSTHFDTTYKMDIKDKTNSIMYHESENDEKTLSYVHRILQDTGSNAYDVIFATLEYSDHVGHTKGYGTNDAYIGASQYGDHKGYELLQTIQQRDTYNDEDWLILITSDHGGIGFGHGGQRDEEVNTWFVVNKPLEDIMK